jgi:hypothetical protein
MTDDNNGNGNSNGSAAVRAYVEALGQLTTEALSRQSEGTARAVCDGLQRDTVWMRFVSTIDCAGKLQVRISIVSRKTGEEIVVTEVSSDAPRDFTAHFSGMEN